MSRHLQDVVGVGSYPHLEEEIDPVEGYYVFNAFGDDVNGVVGSARIGDGEGGRVSNCVGVCVGAGAGGGVIDAGA